MSQVFRMSLFLIILTGLFSTEEASGQTYLAKEYHFSSCKGQCVITRENGTGVPIMSYRGTYGEYFVYGNWGTGTANYFNIPDTTYQDAITCYMVNDMQVIGESCYFCGCRTHSTIVNNMVVTDSVGFIGRLHLNDWECSGPANNIKYQLRLVSETKTLERLAAKELGGDTILAMTGIANLFNSISCLVVAKRTYLSTSWRYDIWMTNDSPETFTDIVIDVKNIVLASRRNGQAESTKFYLRSAGLNAVIYSEDYSNFDNRNKFNTQTASLECTTQGLSVDLAHDMDAQIRLCAIPWETVVHVAYECHSSSSLLQETYSTALGRIETSTSPMTMDNIQVTAGQYDYPGTFIDMKYIYNNANNYYLNAVAILHVSDDEPKSIIEYPYSLLSDYGGLYSAFKQTSSIHLFNSMSVFNGKDIRFGGRFKSAALNLVHLITERQYLLTKEWCLSHSDIEVCTSNDTLTAGIENSPLIQYGLNLPDFFSWGNLHTAQLSTATGEITCSKTK